MPPPSAAQQQDEAVSKALDKKRLDDLEAQVMELRADRDKFLRWGVITLGMSVVALVTWIFNLITRHP